VDDVNFAGWTLEKSGQVIPGDPGTRVLVKGRPHALSEVQPEAQHDHRQLVDALSERFALLFLLPASFPSPNVRRVTWIRGNAPLDQRLWRARPAGMVPAVN